jgi:hypothetical protein
MAACRLSLPRFPPASAGPLNVVIAAPSTTDWRAILEIVPKPANEASSSRVGEWRSGRGGSVFARRLRLSSGRVEAPSWRSVGKEGHEHLESWDGSRRGSTGTRPTITLGEFLRRLTAGEPHLERP